MDDTVRMHSIKQQWSTVTDDEKNREYKQPFVAEQRACMLWAIYPRSKYRRSNSYENSHSIKTFALLTKGNSQNSNQLPE